MFKIFTLKSRINGPFTEVLAELKEPTKGGETLGNSNRKKPLPSLDVKRPREEAMLLEPSENWGSGKKASRQELRLQVVMMDPQPGREGVGVNR